MPTYNFCNIINYSLSTNKVNTCLAYLDFKILNHYSLFIIYILKMFLFKNLPVWKSFNWLQLFRSSIFFYSIILAHSTWLSLNCISTLSSFFSIFLTIYSEVGYPMNSVPLLVRKTQEYHFQQIILAFLHAFLYMPLVFLSIVKCN